MENVVYFLGAGFSAPLGLPVMSNFLEKSKDQFAYSRMQAEGNQYDYFLKIYEEIKKMHFIKSFYESNLFNIEEILSILEMRELFSSDLKTQFLDFIRDVILYHTPEIDNIEAPKTLIETKLFDNPLLDSYGLFVGSLFNLKIRSSEVLPSRKYLPFLEFNSNPSVNYSVISLNYDVILEKFSNTFNKLFHKTKEINDLAFSNQITRNKNEVSLLKLHGSVNNIRIIPPTWNKFLDRENDRDSYLIKQWSSAYTILENANHLRILGYSLPETDTYIKYLLKSAIVANDNLKRIDVICLDPYGDVKNRYIDFILFKNRRFVSDRIEDYLNKLQHKFAERGIESEQQISIINYNKLESAHEEYMVSA